MAQSKVVVLLSGGLDSATTLAMAIDNGMQCHSMSFDYGQRNRAELDAASIISTKLGALEHKIMQIDLGKLGGSALTDNSIPIPTGASAGIPVTYVPARNTIFLSFALAWAEILDANAIYIGVNAVDYSGYPDCRPEFINAFEAMANLATKTSVDGNSMKIKTPLIKLTKAEIIKQGHKLGLDYGMTVSCYQADSKGRGCGECDSCLLRIKGFTDAGIVDPTRYF